MAVWEAEREHGLLRSDLLPSVATGSTNGKPAAPEPVHFYCSICLVTCNSQESFENHCSSIEHVQMISADSSMQWVHRAPPLGLNKFSLCSRAEVCEMGNSCTKAHSKEELQEWIQRVEVSMKKKKQALKDGLLSYQDRLLDEYKKCSNEVLIMAEHVEGVQVVCEQPLHVQLEDRKKKYQWRFKIHSQVTVLRLTVFGSSNASAARGPAEAGAWSHLLLLGEWAFPGSAVHLWGARGHRVLLAPHRAGGGQHGELHPGHLRAVGGL
uniref:Uncharacterized protein n=1 Tax=Zosterops lateralis melanops TaxID=1220523 RepID=A0A8D2QLE9_ZOSLA